MGKLLVLEGIDGCGKSTQLKLLEERLKREKTECLTVSFPDYGSEASAPVRMYLRGEFGSDPGAVNAYAASAFYAVDRYASFRLGWGDYYLGGGTVICGRYATSNAVHQAAKLPENERGAYVNWLFDFEYAKLGLPRPDAVILLDMPPEVSLNLLSRRYGGDDGKKDIHERDPEYLSRCRDVALFAARYAGWKTVNCAENGEPRSAGDIAGEVYEIAREVLKKGS